MLNITNNCQFCGSVKFGDMEAGDGFQFNDDFYMKVGDSREPLNAVKLCAIPHLEKFHADTLVEPVDIDVIINYRGEGS